MGRAQGAALNCSRGKVWMYSERFVLDRVWKSVRIVEECGGGYGASTVTLLYCRARCVPHGLPGEFDLLRSGAFVRADLSRVLTVDFDGPVAVPVERMGGGVPWREIGFPAVGTGFPR